MPTRSGSQPGTAPFPGAAPAGIPRQTGPAGAPANEPPVAMRPPGPPGPLTPGAQPGFGQPGPGQPGFGQPGVGFAPGMPPQPPRRTRGQAVAVFCVVFSLIVGIGALVLGFTVTGGASGQMGDAAIPSPTEGDEPQVRLDYLTATAQVELDEHSDALLAGDEAGWLDVFDASLHDDMRRQYTSLRNLEVSQYEYVIQGNVQQISDTQFGFRLGVSYCFGGTVGEECADAAIVFDTVWNDDANGFYISEVEDSDETGPRPWEVEDIEAVSGEKVIVAAPSQYADQLDDALASAEEAAINADQYAVYGEIEKYLVYLAGNAEFSRWYGLEGANMDNVVGFAMPVPVLDEEGRLSSGGYEVVMHIDRVRDQADFNSTMRHELGHVATLNHSKTDTAQPEDWWMVEGIAEVIDHDPEVPLDSYLRQRDVQAYIDEDLWNGELDPVYNTDDGLTGSAKYGLAMYAVYYLFNEYGMDQFMDLFERVARNGEDPNDSTQAVYGKSYDELVEECATFIESITD